MFLVPSVLDFVRIRLGWKRVAFSLIPAVLLLVVLYAAASLRYYHTRVYPFDPFLQLPPQRFGPEEVVRATNAYQIVTLGGSTTRMSTYPVIVKQVLTSQLPALQIEVYNVGVPYYTTKHSLINYVTHTEGLMPHLVIVMHAINDLVRSCEPPDLSMGYYNDDWSHFYGAAIRAAQPVTFEKHLFLKYLGIVYSFYDNQGVDYDVTHFRAIGPFRKHLRRIVWYAQGDDAEVLLVTQPSAMRASKKDGVVRPTFASVFCKSDPGFMRRVWPSVKSMRWAMAAFNDVTRDVAKSQGTLLLDAASTMDNVERYFYDEVHHTGLGGETLGRLVAQLILEKGLVLKRIGTGPSGERRSGSQPDRLNRVDRVNRDTLGRGD